MEKEKLLEILGADFDSEKLEALTGFINKSSQSNEDRIRTDYSKKNKELEERLKAKEMENMSELEKKAAIIKEKEQLLNEKHKDTIFREKTMFLKENGYSLDLIEYINGDEVDQWEKSYNSINSVIDKVVGSRIKSESGRDEIGGNKEPKKIDQNKAATDAFDNKF